MDGLWTSPPISRRLPDGTLDLKTPRAFKPLISRAARYKGARGGRGSGKSHFVAEELVTACLSAHHRIACTREFQSSLQDSNKKLIEDKIIQLGLVDMFQSTKTEIRGPNDSLFIFRGLDGNSADSLKSIEGFTRCWVEEAQTISARSLMLLTPSFRSRPTSDGSAPELPELWFTWNPTAPDDPVESLFAPFDDGDPDFERVTVNYPDNPWFPDDLRSEMERDRRRDPDKYAHVWLGAYQKQSQSRVFHNWTIREFATPPNTRFYFGADWGFAQDPTVLVRCWLKDRELYVDEEAYQVGCEIDHTPALFERVEGSRRWPIRADSARPETISYMKRAGFSMSPAVKGPNSVEDGIEFLKNYDIVVHPRCRHTSDELSRYSYKVDKRTMEVLPVLADKDNHVIDALRYALEGFRRASGTYFSDVAVAQLAMSRG